MGAENLASTSIRSPDRLSYSESVYRVSYPCPERTDQIIIIIIMCVCVGFVMCGCFGNVCTCIYCVLYCTVFLYCFVYVYLFLFVLSVLV